MEVDILIDASNYVIFVFNLVIKKNKITKICMKERHTFGTEYLMCPLKIGKKQER
jgi:hypothetical protein